VEIKFPKTPWEEKTRTEWRNQKNTKPAVAEYIVTEGKLATQENMDNRNHLSRYTIAVSEELGAGSH